MPLDADRSAAQRSRYARLAAYSMHAQHDARETTKNAREAFLAKFLDAVDPDRVLPEPERARRATAARKAHMLRLSIASAAARRRRTPRTATSQGEDPA